MSKKILVTGGEGFIGTHLVSKLKSDGFKVVVADKKSGVDINDNKLESVFKKHKFDCVVHLAGEVGVRDSFKRPKDYLNTNIMGTYKVTELVAKHQVKQFIFASSSSVYGKRSDKRGFKETDRLEPISIYAASKVAAEKICEMFAGKYKINTTILRFFTVFGPDNRRDMAVFKFTDAIAKNKQIQVYGKNTKRDFTYVDDIVEAIVLCIKKPFRFKIINLGNSNPITVLKLVRTIEKHLGLKPKIIKKPLPKGDVPVTFANISKANKLLGWKPVVNIDKGIKTFIDWYKKAFKL